MLDFGRFTHLTFDCYGTLIDWETGILGVLQGVLAGHSVQADDRRLLDLYSRLEAEEERGPYKPYREVLRAVMARIASQLAFEPTESDLDALPGSLGSWPPFPDTVPSLRKLETRYKLVILSNVDDALFAKTAHLLEVPFDDVITAEQVGSYKPSLRNFEFALARLGVDKDRVLHVAQSLFHDHAPAKSIGLATVRIDRPTLRKGLGLALPVEVEPDLTVPDLKSLYDSTVKT
jgi:2-haloacid dehalogenase